MLVGSHVSRAGNRKDRAVAIEEMFVHRERLAAREQCGVVDPEGVVVSENVRLPVERCLHLV